MPKRLTVLMLFVLFMTGCRGRYARSFTYKLHNPQNSDQSSTLHSMPDGALLMVATRNEQPRQVWNLLRITDWETSHPREDKLDVDVGPNEELLREEDKYDHSGQLLMDPGGNYLVVRLSQDADSSNLNPESAKPPRSVLNIIDLQGFKLLRRIAITDPPLAAGDMGFSPKGAFIVSGLQEHSSATIGGTGTQTGRYAVETLTLPGLEPKTVCRYTMVTRSYSAQSPSTPEESRRTEKEHDEEVEREEKQRQAADNECAPKLAPLGFSSLDDVHRAFNFWGWLEYNADYTLRIRPDAKGPWGCGFEDLSGDLQYALLDCDEGRVVVFGRYRAFRVFRLADGKQIMDLKVPRSTLFGERRVLFSGVLATRRGVTYVVLLRDGAELEGYRVP
jgi:hypothetical protein